MICTLLEAIEMNEAFSRRLLETTTQKDIAILRMSGAMTGYHLGRITKGDMKNWEIYAEMSTTITKISDRLDELLPEKKP